MKTALQELIEKFDIIIEALEKEKFFLTASGVINSRNLAISLIEKEKEQIVKSYYDAQIALLKIYEDNTGIKIIDKFINDFDDAKEYYNKTYNQNK